MVYKMWHLVVAFILGAVVVAGVTLAPGSLAQGKLTLSPVAGKVCEVTACDLSAKLDKISKLLTKPSLAAIENRLINIESKLNKTYTSVKAVEDRITRL